MPPVSIKDIAAKAARDILKKHPSGFYRPLVGEDGGVENFSIVSATDWVGEEVVLSVTDYMIGMVDRDYRRGDQVVTDADGTYEIHEIINREGAMLTLRAVKL